MGIAVSPIPIPRISRWNGMICVGVAKQVVYGFNGITSQTMLYAGRVRC